MAVAPPLIEMRILLLCEGDPETNDSWSGVSRSVLQVLRAAGHEVLTADVDLYGAPRYLAAALSFAPVRHRWAARFHFGRSGFELRSRIAARHIAAAKGKIDVILQFGATFEARGRGAIPYALYCDSHIGWTERGQEVVRTDIGSLTHAEIESVRRREAAVYRGASHIFTMSACVGASFVESYGIPAERVTPVHAGPNLDLTRIPESRGPRGDHPPTVLFIGRQFERKGGDLLLRAFARVRRALPEAELLIIGPPEIPGDHAGVTSLGFVSKDRPGGWEAIAEAYRRADVFCLPTRFEPFGIVFVEAMHFGVPCVGPDAWAVPEIIDDGRTGLTVRPDDELDLAEKLVTLLRDPALSARMGAASRVRARELFTWEAVGRKMEAGLAGLVPQAAVHA